MINIKNLFQGYKNEYLYQDFNISFERNKISSIIGPSGCGKTTLLRIMAGLETYESGSIEGIDENKLSFVFQEDRLLPWLTVYENIALVLKDKHIPISVLKEKIDEVLDLLKLFKCRNMIPDELSGGMQRRVAIGRALAYDLALEGQIMLLDEPFKGLDEKLKAEILSELIEICKRYKKTIILVTHDLDDVNIISDDIYEFFSRPVKWKKILIKEIGK